MIENKDVKFIEIVFENCESIQIPIERFEYINLRGIKQYLIHRSRKELQLPNSLRYECEYASFGISYKDDSELEYSYKDSEEPLGMFVGNPTSNKVADRPNILGRIIEHSDISHLGFLDENENQIIYLFVPFEGENTNDLMEFETTQFREKKTLRVSLGDIE